MKSSGIIIYHIAFTINFTVGTFVVVLEITVAMIMEMGFFYSNAFVALQWKQF